MEERRVEGIVRSSKGLPAKMGWQGMLSGRQSNARGTGGRNWQEKCGWVNEVPTTKATGGLPERGW